MLSTVQTSAAAVETASPPRLTYLIKRLEMAERARMEEVLQPLGVTLHQYTALSVLEHRGGLSSAQLARRNFVSPQASNQLVALLERHGLIERRSDSANRRILRMWLTDDGRALLAACHRAVDVIEERMLSALTGLQASDFRIALERSLAALTRS
jgi:DNA-binding MarR family transcriptional regulator